RVIQCLENAVRMLGVAGIDSRLVTEQDLVVGRGGAVRLRGGRREVDLVAMITIGTSFMDEPERLLGDLAHLRGPKVGRARLVKPLASLAMDKGTIPFLSTLPGWPVRGPGGYRSELIETGFPHPEFAPEYRRHRERYVLKRSFDGKDTRIGISTDAKTWDKTLKVATEGADYVIQEYVPLPRTTMPVIYRGKSIEWIPVRVELSPFVVEGRYAGAIARYAPDADGLVLSPPPRGMGLTMVYSA
ncbi:MAG: hypothetical protein HY901_06535, partial [Deltaproteobacteria bacterium]|nr:hypothetical protein [Deltaproteobacteria bacterium]